MRLCEMDGCDRKHKARGYCRTHWARWRRHGSPHVVLNPQPSRPADPPRLCDLPGCDVEHYGRGRCYRHWRAWRREMGIEGKADPAVEVEADPESCVDCGGDRWGDTIRCEPCLRADMARRSAAKPVADTSGHGRDPGRTPVRRVSLPRQDAA